MIWCQEEIPKAKELIFIQMDFVQNLLNLRLDIDWEELENQSIAALQ